MHQENIYSKIDNASTMLLILCADNSADGCNGSHKSLEHGSNNIGHHNPWYAEQH